MPVKPTPPRGLPVEANVFDSIGARELELFIDNDAMLYRQMHQPVQRNMLRKMRAGKYDPELAVKGFMHLADEGARRYNVQYGPGQSTLRGFDKPTRTAVARSLARSFEAEARLGNMDYLLPGKPAAPARRPSFRKGRRLTLTK